MKKLNSFEDLGSLVNDKSKLKKQFKIPNNLSKQNLEAHYSAKGRAGTPVIILKGFSGLKKDDLKNLAKPIKNKLGIGGSVKKNEIFFQGDKREKIISILESQGHSVKRIGG